MTEVAAEPALGSERSSITRSAGTLAAGVSSGFIAGLLIGGVGGRVAMFILRLTSDASVLGVESDDGFIIGRFSLSTLFLLLATAFLGSLGGVFYLVVRGWLPTRARVPLMAGYFAVVGGAAVISGKEGGTDFTQLAPLPLAIGFFIAIPALYGVAMSLMAERFLRDGSYIRRTKYGWLAGVIPMVLLQGFGIVILLASAAAYWVAQKSPRIVGIWRSNTVAWMGRAFLVATAAYMAVTLAKSAIEIL